MQTTFSSLNYVFGNMKGIEADPTTALARSDVVSLKI
jgi:hypothetical protein